MLKHMLNIDYISYSLWEYSGGNINILAPDPKCISKHMIKQMHSKSVDMSNIT